MKALFRTAHVEYLLENNGYSRNGHFVQGKVTLKQLAFGKPAIFEIETPGYSQVIRTDDVLDIQEMPLWVKGQVSNEVHPYRVYVSRKENPAPLVVMKIGTKAEVEKWAKDRWSDEQIRISLIPIPASRQAN